MAWFLTLSFILGSVVAYVVLCFVCAKAYDRQRQAEFERYLKSVEENRKQRQNATVNKFATKHSRND